MFEPSPEWTDEERRKVVLQIALQLKELAYQGTIVPTKARDFAERIELVLTAGVSVLEANRNTILTGE